MNIKNTVLGLVIFGAGFGVGYTFKLKTLKEQYKEDLTGNKEWYTNKLREAGVMEQDFNPAEIVDQIIEDDEAAYVDEEIKEYFDKVMGYSSIPPTEPGVKGRPIIKYNKPPLEVVSHPYSEDEYENEEEYEPLEDEIDAAYEAELEERAEDFARRRHENESNGLPYVIEFDEWEDAPEQYDKQFLYYYTVDRVLCEDDDSMVEDEEGLVGLDYEDVLDMQTTAWVRNDTLMTMYEIVRIDGSYNELVANVVETPREREYRLMGRRKQGMDNK